jgi:hypothetical protein
MISKIISSEFPNEKAEIIANALRNKLLISNGCLYEITDKITYKLVKCEIKMKILTAATEVLQEAFQNNLTKKEHNKLENKFKTKEIKETFSNKSVLEYYPQLYNQLENNDIKFDDYICQIHFLNGYMDLKTLEFKQRVLHEDFVTDVIKRNYVKSNDEDKKQILKHVNKIYPKQEDLENILLVLGSCLSGKANIDQDTLFLLGLGSSGKSFTLELTAKSIQMYLKELKDDTFSHNNAKADKILNTFDKSPYVRITWINEIKDTKIDDSLFKSFCDGKAQTTKLYQDGSNSIELKSKAIITANTMPNIKIDTGTTRRILSYTHQSNFVDLAKDVDEKNHIYLKDKDIISKIAEHECLLNAWFDMLATYCQKWLNGEKMKYNKNFEETKLNVTASNDIFQDFIDSKIKITGNSDDRVGKNEMAKAFGLMYPNKCLTVQQIMNSLKEKGLKYEGTLRCKSDGVKGCYMGVKLEDHCETDDATDEEDDDKDYVKLYHKLLKENAELKKLLNK